MSAEFEFHKSRVFPYRIESDRLVYEPLHMTDVSVKEFFKINNSLSEEDTQHVTFSPHETMIEAQEVLERSEEDYYQGESVNYAMYTKDDNSFIGTCSFEVDWNRKKAESGVFLYPEYWGNGYGTERGETMIKLAFEEHKLDVWISRVAVENEASINSIEKYVVDNGGQRVGVIPNYEYPEELRDIVMYTLRRDNCTLDL